MNRINLGVKSSGETTDVVFPFLSSLAIGESLSSAVTTAAVYSGTDASPSAIIDGSASVSSPNATQSITAGTSGVTYNLTCTGTSSTGQILTIVGYLVVVPTTS